MVKSRSDFLDKGYYDSLADKITSMIGETASSNMRLIDLGCGECFYTSRVAKAFPDLAYGGIDISKQALIAGSKRNKNISLAVASVFNCKIGDRLSFAEPETLVCEKIDTDSILDGKHYPTLNNETDIVITKDIFDGDALILSGMKSDTVYLESDLHPQKIKFNFGKAPVLGIWAKPGAEYVCIEPWYGINDSREVKDDFSQKRLIQKLEPGEEFVFPWSAEIIE